MESLKRKDVVKAAKEFNQVVQLADEDGNPTPVNVKSEELEKELFDALEFIEEGDEFSDETDKVFNELKIKFTPKPVVKEKSKKKNKKEKSVEVGATVELYPDTDEIKKEDKKMKKVENGSEMADAARLVLDRGTKKEQLMELLEGDLFSKKQKKELKGVTNFLSLKKQMKEALDPEVVAEVEAELKSAPKAPAKPKVKTVKDSPLVAEIKAAIKVKQLKKIAKANDQFNWKVLKALDFDEMQRAMLSGAKPEVKVKMIPNPLITEIESFKKAKKLVKWAKENEEVGYTKAMKKMDLADLQEALIASIPAEIKKESGKKSGGKRVVVNNIDQEARKARIIGLVDEGTHTRKEIHAILKEEFPEEGTSHTNSNILSECKSTVPYKDGQRWERFGIGRLVTEDKNGCYVWADEVKPKKEKKNKKDKKNKKSKK